MPVYQGVQKSFSFDADTSELPANKAPRLIEWVPAHWPVAEDWHPVVDTFLASDVARKLGTFVRARLAEGAAIYPPQPFRALALTPLSQVKVLILGQDPYHGPGQAEGLAFSVAPGVKFPPSLKNIFKEVARDPLLECGGAVHAVDGSLVRWAQQGVLLLNTCLTVEDGQPASHASRGWEVLTDAIVAAISMKQDPVVFMLWGAHAQAKLRLIAEFSTKAGCSKAPHLVLTANHPSPLSAMRPPKPFVGCGHFGLANIFLTQHECPPIAW